MLRRHMVRIATAVLVTTAAVITSALPSAAQPASTGPNDVCQQNSYVDQSIGSNNDVVATFALNGHYIINGFLNQNFDVAGETNLPSFTGQSTSRNFVEVGVNNDAGVTVTVAGWLSYMWNC